MKKLLKVLLVLTLAFTLVACGGDDAEETEAADAPEVTEATDAPEETEEETEAGLEGEVSITGSTSVAGIVEELLNEFEANNPNVSITYTGTGSSAGVEDSINSINDLGMASRALKDEELEAGVRGEAFAQDGVAVIVHPSNGVEELTTENILNIFAGEITNWSEVGGVDAPINVFAREASSGTRGAFEELTGLEDVGMTEDAAEFSSNGALQIAVAGDENSIGYVSFTYLDDTVKGLVVDGGEPTVEDVKAGNYPLARPFNVVINDDNYSEVAEAFVDFMFSTEGQDIVEAEGGIRID